MHFLHSHHIRRYWFYVKNDFRNFHQIFTLCDPLSQKKRFLQKCLSFCVRSSSSSGNGSISMLISKFYFPVKLYEIYEKTL